MRRILELLIVCAALLPGFDLDDLDIKLDKPDDPDAAAAEEVQIDLVRVWNQDRDQAWFIDPVGDVIAGPFQDAYHFHDGLGLAQGDDDIYRLYDATGAVAMQPPEYSAFRSVFREGLVVIQKGNTFAYVDRQGEEVLGGFQQAQAFEGGFAMAAKGGTYGVINRDGRMILNRRPFRYHFGDDYAAVLMNPNGAWYFIDTDGERVVGGTWQQAGRFAEGLAPVLFDPQEGEWTFVDKWGEPFDQRKRFDEARHFSQGRAPARKRDRWGFIDKEGDWAVRPKFDDLRPLVEGRAAFYDADAALWGFVDREGDVVIEAQYTGVFDFENGLALVADDSGDIYIDRRGAQIWPKP